MSRRQDKEQKPDEPAEPPPVAMIPSADVGQQLAAGFEKFMNSQGSRPADLLSHAPRCRLGEHGSILGRVARRRAARAERQDDLLHVQVRDPVPGGLRPLLLRPQRHELGRPADPQEPQRVPHDRRARVPALLRAGQASASSAGRPTRAPTGSSTRSPTRSPKKRCSRSPRRPESSANSFPRLMAAES